MVAQTLPSLPDLTPEQAEQWVSALLAEARALRQHEEQLFPATDDTAAVGIAEQLRAAWKMWVNGAEALLARLRPLLQAKRHISGAYDLDYTIGRVNAMLSVTPQVMRQRREQAQAGQVHTVEEVRRELRASPRG